MSEPRTGAEIKRELETRKHSVMCNCKPCQDERVHSAYRYSIHTGTKKPVEPRESWQQAEYERVMGHEPPDLSLPQFDYNPRTKAGKTLLEELADNE